MRKARCQNTFIACYFRHEVGSRTKHPLNDKLQLQARGHDMLSRLSTCTTNIKMLLIYRSH
jgi:hypothetical protein